VSGQLKGRLSRLNKGREGAAARARPADSTRPKPGFLDGWEGAGEHAWTRMLDFPNPLPESLDPEAFAPLRRRGLARDPEPDGRVPAASLRFLDLETTGLSGGAGTIAFLASIGFVGEGGGFTLAQAFLDDFPGEPAFLGAVLGLLEPGSTIVSYNGRAFDLPLLRTRCVLNGVPAPSLPHVDALFAARRLWKRIHGGASLGLLEREVLGIERGEDIPGALIPEAWLSFARTGSSGLMPLVLSHNADDVVGLARLAARAQAIFDDPLSEAALSGVDRFGLGRGLLAAGREAEGEELLEAAAAEGEDRAALLLLRRYRRAGRDADCLRVEPWLSSTYRAAAERAKLYERTIGNLVLASRWAAEALSLASSDAERAESELRAARIARKAGREAGGGINI
jgi:uncharacterized protein